MTNFQVSVFTSAWLVTLFISFVLLYRLLFVYNWWYDIKWEWTIGRKMRQREQRLRAGTFRLNTGYDIMTEDYEDDEKSLIIRAWNWLKETWQFIKDFIMAAIWN